MLFRSFALTGALCLSALENTLGTPFGRHTNRASGVRSWFNTVALEWDFTYAAGGKKGGY